MFHIFVRPRFEEQYSLFCATPEAASLSWIALLFAILGTAVNAVDAESPILTALSRHATPSARIADLSARYRTAAMRCLEADQYLWRHNLQTLQALLVLIYGISHSHGQSWSLLGLACNIGVAIGCHVDPGTLELDVISCEERKRCFTGLRMLLISQSLAMGNLGLQNGGIASNTPLPLDVADENISTGLSVSPSSHSASSPIAYMLSRFRLFKLCAEICGNDILGSNAKMDDVNRLDNAILMEKQIWQQRYGGGDAHPPTGLNFVYMTMLEAYSCHISILLHTPVLANPVLYSAHNAWSRHRCWESSRRMLEIHHLFDRSPDFKPFQWYHRGRGSFHAFHAAVCLTALVSTSQPTDERNETHDTADLLRGCLFRFQAMVDLSPVCARASPVLNSFLCVSFHALLSSSFGCLTL